MYLTIQEVAARTGLSAHTIRYCEKSDVLPRVQRTKSGICRGGHGLTPLYLRL
jgi:DNA-binding transcriptional MerR regulator